MMVDTYLLLICKDVEIIINTCIQYSKFKVNVSFLSLYDYKTNYYEIMKQVDVLLLH